MESLQSIENGEGSKNHDHTITVISPDPSSASYTALTSHTNPDFVLVWNNTEKDAKTDKAYEKRSVFEYNLAEEEGLVLQWENVESAPELQVVKIWASLEVLKRYSEILKLRLPMNQLELPQCIGSSDSSQLSSQASLKKESSCFSKFSLDCFTLDPELFPKRCRKLTRIYSRDKEYL